MNHTPQPSLELSEGEANAVKLTSKMADVLRFVDSKNGCCPHEVVLANCMLGCGLLGVVAFLSTLLKRGYIEQERFGRGWNYASTDTGRAALARFEEEKETK